MIQHDLTTVRLVRTLRTLRRVLETQVQTEDQAGSTLPLTESAHITFSQSASVPANAPAPAALWGCPEVLAPLQLSPFSLQSDEARAQSARLGNNFGINPAACDAQPEELAN